MTSASFRTLEIQEIPLRVRHQIMIGCVVPRPIAWVSTVSPEGIPNLAPFSFFNAFSSNPPIVAFGPAYRGRDGSIKDTLYNIQRTGEMVIHLIPENLRWACALTSLGYPPEVNEIEKAGLTAIPSVRVQPPGILESPVRMECRSRGILQVSFGKAGGNLVLAEVLLLHIREDLLDDEGLPDPRKTTFLFRLNRFWYGVIRPDTLMEVPAREPETGIGVDQLPGWIRDSAYFTVDDLCNLAMVPQLPEAFQSEEDIQREVPEVRFLLPSSDRKRAFFLYARDLLRRGERARAWSVLRAYQYYFGTEDSGR